MHDLILNSDAILFEKEFLQIKQAYGFKVSNHFRLFMFHVFKPLRLI
ncbi:hypothetical protein GCM10010392_68980 [Streptomyces clavifer]|nr:hypothetical protein GCM10010392_68980 [Streptomyces clavifer]